MRILLNLFAFFFSIILIYLAIFLFLDITRLQTFVHQFNDASGLDFSNAEMTLNTAQTDKGDFRFLSWDSEVNQILATVNSSIATSLKNKGKQQRYLSKAQHFYKQSLKFTPRNIHSIIGDLSLLIDQGAPLDYFLPRINELILLIPKDQDLKADIAMLCFKLSILNQDAQSQVRLVASLNALFTNSMDYRGMIRVRRYAKLFDQDELLARVDMNVKN